MPIRTTLMAVLILSACGGTPAATETTPALVGSAPGPAAVPAQPIAVVPAPRHYPTEEERMLDAAQHASPGPRRVLETAHAMIRDATIIRGSCWDWVHEVFARAHGDTVRVYGARVTGPFADTSLIQPGDWVYLNHVPEGGTHSAIFVGWTDAPNRVALMVSYAGMHSDSPGRFGEYDLSAVYRVMRLSDSEETPPPPRRQHRHHSR